LYESASNAICRTTSEVVSGTLHESRDQFSTVEVRQFVSVCCGAVSQFRHGAELQSNFVSNWIKVLPKLMNFYKKRMEVILCLVQRNLNGLNDFEKVGSRWRMAMEKSRVKTMFIVFFDAQGVIHREFVPEGQTVKGQFYLGVMERLLKRIRRVRPEFHN
jgi:hypothetical protein